MTPSPKSLRSEADWSRERLDADYTARACVSVAEFDWITREYLRRSGPAQALPGTRLGVRYDPKSGEGMDIFATGGGRPVFLFIHGGYWRALSRAHSAFMAPMLASHGIATAVPDYTLAPMASLAEIIRQIRTAFAHLWHNAQALGINRDRIIVGGSSAGGHLAAALAMPGWQRDFDLPADALHAALPVSGLFELAPLAASHVQGWMRFTPAELQALSPARHIAGTTRSLIALAANETAGFTRQSAAYARALGTNCVTIPERNHFDVILGLAEPNSLLSWRLLGLFAP